MPEKESTEIKRLLIVFVVVNFLGSGTGLPEVIERGSNSESEVDRLPSVAEFLNACNLYGLKHLRV